LSNASNQILTAAIIAGTGFETAFGSVEERLPVQTPYGEAFVQVVPHDCGTLLFLPRHGGRHSVPPHKINVRAQIWALKELGVDAVLATAATGSLRIDLLPGNVVLLDDFIDFRGQTTTFFDGSDGRVRHTDVTHPFDEYVRDNMLLAATEVNSLSDMLVKVFDRGTYVCTSGPRYETPAEVRLFASWGGDVVGMTVAPEAILARELGIRYAAAAVVTNLGAGLSQDILSHGDVHSQMLKSQWFLAELFRSTITKLFESIGS
jgi:5'-methylthioadenosine phosphorylase